MVTQPRSIGTTSECVANAKDGHLIDILVQNLSANNVYVGDSPDVTTLTGIKLVATTGSWSNDKRKSSVYLIADGASSDVRVTVETYKEGSR